MEGSRRKKEVVPDVLLKIRTSNQWSLLDAVARRIHISVDDLERMLCEIDNNVLERNGIWIQDLGQGYIICTNPSYRMNRMREGQQTCKCGKDHAERATKRYFGSTDYNAGRHAVEVKHKPNCSHWRPPKAGHLHSWRRGYRKNVSKKGKTKKRKKK